MRLSIIVAMDKNSVIGADGQLPWHLSSDLKNFKRITMGKPIVMGRKTYESIGRPLPGRENIILTRDKTYQQPGCTVLHEVDSLLAYCKDKEEIMITGGSEIYKLLLDKASRIYLTEVEVTVDGDTFFPKYYSDQWRETSRTRHPASAGNDHDFSFVVLDRINS